MPPSLVPPYSCGHGAAPSAADASFSHRPALHPVQHEVVRPSAFPELKVQARRTKWNQSHLDQALARLAKIAAAYRPEKTPGLKACLQKELTINDFKDILFRNFRLKLPLPHLVALFTYMDKDSSNTISYVEFLVAFTRMSLKEKEDERDRVLNENKLIMSKVRIPLDHHCRQPFRILQSHRSPRDTRYSSTLLPLPTALPIPGTPRPRQSSPHPHQHCAHPRFKGARRSSKRSSPPRQSSIYPTSSLPPSCSLHSKRSRVRLRTTITSVGRCSGRSRTKAR